MRVLLDEQLPVDFAVELTGHDVDTVVGRGWTGVKNGELLRRMSGLYDALVTMDRSMEFQQNVSALPFGLVVVRAPSNRMVHVRPLVTAILGAIAATNPGTVQRIGTASGSR